MKINGYDIYHIGTDSGKYIGLVCDDGGIIVDRTAKLKTKRKALHSAKVLAENIPKKEKK